VLVALQLQAPPATNLAGCTEVNGKCINHKYVPGTGLLLDLVAMLLLMYTCEMDRRFAGRTSWTSGARFSSRHCKGAPATPFPPANGQYHHQPHQLLRSGRILAKQANPVDRQAVD
jgi:hypothetical protein